MENIKDALAAADPDGKDAYEANCQKWGAEFDKLDVEFKSGGAKAEMFPPKGIALPELKTVACEEAVTGNA